MESLDFRLIRIREKKIKLAKEYLESIKDRPNSLYWRNTYEYEHSPEYYYKGIVFNYKDSTDLTASIILMHLSGHEFGDVPKFFIKDVIDFIGSLWNEEISNRIFNYANFT